jgi:adenosylcobinamide kinase/adenosylcobinamide-phosphate guanylyltransferase
MNWCSALILGGARSGKTSRALGLAEPFAKRIYIATAEALDDEMATRIKAHRLERGAAWRTIEAPLNLPATIENLSSGDSICVVDCLTLWLSNLIGAGSDVDAAMDALCRVIPASKPKLVLVSNEVGLGLVPETLLGRAFRDHQGRLNQAIAAVCDRVEFIAAGLPLILKP